MRDAIDRRSFLQRACAVAALPAAGCLNDPDGTADGRSRTNNTARQPSPTNQTQDGRFGAEEGDAPEYAKYIPSKRPGKTNLYFAHTPLMFFATQSTATGESSSLDIKQKDVPLLHLPAEAHTDGLSQVGLSLGPTGAGLSDLFKDDSESELNTKASELLTVHTARIALGDFDAETIEGKLLAKREHGNEYEKVATIGNFTVLEAVTDATYANVLGVGNRAVIASDKPAKVKSVIKSQNDRSLRAVSDYSSFNWMLGTTRDRVFAEGAYNPDGTVQMAGTSEFSNIFSTARGVIGSMTVNERSVTAGLVAVFDGLSEGKHEEIDSVLHGKEDTLNVQFKNNRMIAEATYEKKYLLSYMS